MLALGERQTSERTNVPDTVYQRIRISSTGFQCESRLTPRRFACVTQPRREKTRDEIPFLPFSRSSPSGADYTWITTGRIIGRRPISLLQKAANALRMRRESAVGDTLPLTSLRTISSARRIRPSLSRI